MCVCVVLLTVTKYDLRTGEICVCVCVVLLTVTKYDLRTGENCVCKCGITYCDKV